MKSVSYRPGAERVYLRQDLTYMKPALFEHALAGSVDEATRFLASSEGEAIILAGGKTLMPMLSMRMERL